MFYTLNKKNKNTYIYKLKPHIYKNSKPSYKELKKCLTHL